MFNNIEIISKEDKQYLYCKDYCYPKDFEYKQFTHFELEIASDFSIKMLEKKDKPRYKHEKGKSIRSDKQYLMDNFIGALGEICAYNSLIENEIPCSSPDFKVYNGFDNSDLIIYETFHLSVKTSKANSKLLLLENNKYDKQGRYLHSNNIEPLSVEVFLAPVIKMDKYFIDEKIKPEDYKKFLKSLNPKSNMRGFLGRSSIKECKENNIFYKSGTFLNDSIKLEVDNLAFRLDKLKPIDKLKKF